jgi:prepilin-type N-terminal cleavage/methylation domain-containing protein
MLRKMKGFTLIELMIVVAIIGIMAAIAIPNFMNYMCKSKQTEAKQSLGAIATGNESWAAEDDASSYTTNTVEIGFNPRGTPKYTYYFTGAADSTSFEAGASADAIKSTSTDVWTINQERDLNLISNACI